MRDRILDRAGAFFAWLDRQTVTVGQWLAAFTGVAVIRFLLESFSSRSVFGVMVTDAPTLVHYWFFFFAALCGIACVLSAVTGQARRLYTALLFGLPVIWISPLYDLVQSRGDGHSMSYIFCSPQECLAYFFLYLTPYSMVTPGLRVELIVTIVGCGVYAGLSRRRIGAGLLAAFGVYSLLFVLGAAPSLVYMVANWDRFSDPVTAVDVTRYLHEQFRVAALAGNSLDPTLRFASVLRSFEIRFDYFMTQVNYLASAVFLAGWLRLACPQKFRVVLGNCRPERLAFYLLILGAGMALAVALGVAVPFHWVDGVGILTLMTAWACTWMYVVHANDIADQAIDAISNRHRPLVGGGLSVEDMRQSGLVWLAAGLLGAWAAGYYAFFLNIVFLACAHVYSAPPLRLKRVPMLASALIALAVACTFMAGFFFLSADKKLSAFPLAYVAGGILVFTLGVNIRDMKDIAGDRAQGIMTIPVLFGRYGAQVTGLLFASAFLLVPLVLDKPVLFAVAVPSSLLGYWLAVRKPYRDGWPFVLFFTAAFATAGLLWAS